MLRIRTSGQSALAIAAAMAFVPAAAIAQDASSSAGYDATTTSDASADTASGKRFSVVAGYHLLDPASNPGSVAGAESRIDGDGAPTLSASWNITDNYSMELWGAADKFGHRVKLDGAKAASVKQQPVALSGQYHFGRPDQTFRPFVGLGYYQSNIDDETVEPTGPLAGHRLGMTTPKGAIATAGVDLNINPRWFARADLRYLHGSSDVEVDGAKVDDVRLDPLVVGVGIGARF